MQKSPTQEKTSKVPVDLIRTVAILGVLLLHSANDLTIQVLNDLEIWRWCIVDVYQSVGRMGVPLFVMLTGALLLAPSKKSEDLGFFFKKRLSRIGLPFIFWGIAYFIWNIYVENQPVTIVESILTGPYFQFWYLYMLVGLYILTPFLRLLVAQMTPKLFKYFFILWFIGVSIVPLISLVTPYKLDVNVFMIPGWIGYYVLGAYLVNVKIRRLHLALLTTLGIALTAIGTYFMAMTVGGGQTYYFQEYLSPTMILASIPFFIILSNSKRSSESYEPSKHKWTQKLLRLISENTLPIYLFHMMVIYLLQNGYLGITLNGNTVNSIVGVPLMTIFTLLICLAVIVPLKKVPFLKRLIG